MCIRDRRYESYSKLHKNTRSETLERAIKRYEDWNLYLRSTFEKLNSAELPQPANRWQAICAFAREVSGGDLPRPCVTT